MSKKTNGFSGQCQIFWTLPEKFVPKNEGFRGHRDGFPFLVCNATVLPISSPPLPDTQIRLGELFRENSTPAGPP